MRNAAAKYNGISFNATLIPGPDLLQNLLEIVFRFLKDKIGMSADFDAMLLEAAVPKSECNFLLSF